MRTSIFVAVLVTVFAAPLQKAADDAPEGWLQVCCQDNDKNGDGGISFREYTPFVLELFGMSREELAKLFLKADIDRNSDLDGEECPIVRRGLRDEMKRRVAKILQTYDSNHDDSLDLADVTKIASKEFNVNNASDVRQAFIASDMDFNKKISKPEVTDLLLELRAIEIRVNKVNLNNLDMNKDGIVSYEELKTALKGDLPPMAFKQAFKKVDIDKNFILTPTEFIALRAELAEAVPSDSNERIRRSDDLIHFEEHGFSDDEENDLSDYSDKAFLKTLSHQDRHEIAPRSAEEADTAPPLLPAHKKQLNKKQSVKLSLSKQNNLSGGGRGPSILEDVTVKYDDPEFE